MAQCFHKQYFHKQCSFTPCQKKSNIPQQKKTRFTTNTQQRYLQCVQRRERLRFVAVRHPANRVQFASLVAAVKGFKTLPTTSAATDGHLGWRNQRTRKDESSKRWGKGGEKVEKRWRKGGAIIEKRWRKGGERWGRDGEKVGKRWRKGWCQM